MTRWFGFDLKDFSFLDKCYNVVRYPWFFKELTEETAHLILTQFKGTKKWLVRFSFNDAPNYMISYLSGDGFINHEKIEYLDEQFFLNKYNEKNELIRYENLSLRKLIFEFYHKKKLIDINNYFYLNI